MADMTDRFTVHHYDIGEIWSDRPLSAEELEAAKAARRNMLTFSLRSYHAGGEIKAGQPVRLTDGKVFGMSELTGAQKVQSILDRMFEETVRDGHAGVWTGEEWRAAISAIREEVPSLKLILIDALPDWTHDDWANAVIQVRDTLSGEDKDDEA